METVRLVWVEADLQKEKKHCRASEGLLSLETAEEGVVVVGHIRLIVARELEEELKERNKKY